MSKPGPMTKTEMLDVLSLAAAILEAGSCRYQMAAAHRNKRNAPENDCNEEPAVSEPEAVRFCLEGAVLRAAWELDLITEAESDEYLSCQHGNLEPLAILLQAEVIAMVERSGRCGPFWRNDVNGWWDHHGDKRRAFNLLSRVAHTLESK